VDAMQGARLRRHILAAGRCRALAATTMSGTTDSGGSIHGLAAGHRGAVNRWCCKSLRIQRKLLDQFGGMT
jgi:hypothetical protein